MKLRLSILLLAAAALAAAPAAAQTIKSLGYNTTNGFVTYSGSNSLTFTNAVQFSTNARATTRTNLGLGGSDSVTFSNLSLSSNGSLAIGGMNVTAITSGIDLAFKRAGSTELELKTNGLILHVGSYSFSGGNSNGASTTRTNLGLGATWLTNTNVTNFRTAIGLGTTNAVTFGGITIAESVLTLSEQGEADVYVRNENADLALQAVAGTGQILAYSPISFVNTTNAATTRTNLSLGAANNVTFSNITANGIVNAKSATVGTATNAATAQGIQWSGLGGAQHAAIYGAYDGVAEIALSVGTTSNALSDVATFRSTGMTVSSNAIVGGTLAVSNTATFATNVSIAGSLSVGSLTTTTPSTWALDATQTAAATNGRLTLPSNANVIRLTNNNAISSVTNGVLGAFYYLVNQATNAVTISNVGGITIDGAQNLTLSPNESATLVATGATNVSVANRGDLTDVALGGTANTAPSQTASSGSSLMTRELTDENPLWAIHSVRPMGAFALGSSGTGANALYDVTFGGASVNNGTSTNGYGRASLYKGISYISTYSGQGIRFAQDLSFGALVMSAVYDSTHAIRFIVGANGAAPAPSDTNALSARGFGVEFVFDGGVHKARLFAHNGTSYTNSSLITYGSSGGSLRQTAFVVRSDGTGNVSLHIDGAIGVSPRPPATPNVTIGGGPTADSTDAFVDFVCVGASTGTPSNAGAQFFGGYVEVK